MKKVFVMYQFEIGGVETVFRELSKCYDSPVKLVTVTPQYNKELIDALPSNVEYIPHNNIPILRNLFRLFYSKARVLYILLSILLLPIFLRIRLRRFVAVNFSDTLSSLLISTLSANRMCRVSWVHCSPKALLSSQIPSLYIKLLSFCNSIICICNDQKEELLALFPILSHNNIEVIYNPIDIDTISKYAKESLPILNKPYICMVSRLDERSKDFRTAIKAYAALPQSVRDSYPLYIIGDGPDRDRVRDYIVENNMEQYITMYGRDNNPYKWMANASLFLFSSTSEGLGLVIIEALACGQIVVATDCPIGPREILALNVECGLLVPTGSVNSMRDAIIRVLDPSFPRDIYRENAIIRLKDFSHDIFKKNIEQLFNQYE